MSRGKEKSSNSVLPAPVKNIHTSPPLKLFFSPCSRSLPTRGRALGSLVRCSRGGCVSRGSMWDQWLSLTNSQRAPLISRLRDQNLREREGREGKRGKRKRKMRADLKLHTNARAAPRAARSSFNLQSAPCDVTAHFPSFVNCLLFPPYRLGRIARSLPTNSLNIDLYK